MSLLQFQNVYFKNEDNTILNNINISINPKDFISIVGSSGSGKSTLLKLCNNLISHTEGTILYKSKDILSYDPIELRKEISYCFQTPILFGNTVEDNLIFPFKIRNKQVDTMKLKKLFNEFEMDEKIIKSKIINLSGGEKQRISLIRTLLFYPKILLLDEVTSALDFKNTLIVENVINKLHKDYNICILWVTHNTEQSTKYANKLLTMENGSVKSLEVLR